MTDRQAIITAIAYLADAVSAEAARKIREKSGVSFVIEKPAAPTVTRKFAEVPRDTPCGVCGQVVEPGSGAHDCPKPTVTREQAEYISRLLDDAWEAKTHAKPVGIAWPRYEKEMPAFFRAVADKLEEK